MPDRNGPYAAIVDYSLGNLFSVQRACEHVGLRATITSSRQEILAADAVILPGVGAFGDAMTTLHQLDLVRVLQDITASPKPLIGICLGIQLLMTESHEFGRHKGLGIIDGPVERFEAPYEGERRLKVPQVCWNRIHHPDGSRGGDPWAGTLLDGVPDGAHMYFVHSYIVRPTNPSVVLARTLYGQVEFCSALQRGSVFACQCHPERSGAAGLQIYRNVAMLVQRPGKG